jgi:hypothetical protein
MASNNDYLNRGTIVSVLTFQQETDFTMDVDVHHTTQLNALFVESDGHIDNKSMLSGIQAPPRHVRRTLCIIFVHYKCLFRKRDWGRPLLYDLKYTL